MIWKKGFVTNFNIVLKGMTGNVLQLNWACSIVEKFFMMYNYWVWAQSRLSKSPICVITFWESIFFIIILNFLFLTNLFADFYKFFKCHLFNKNSRNSTENVCEQREIIETNNRIRLHIFDVNFYFLNLFLNNLLVYCRIVNTFYAVVI